LSSIGGRRKSIGKQATIFSTDEPNDRS
jgi:hypothetical protein